VLKHRGAEEFSYILTAIFIEDFIPKVDFEFLVVMV